MKIICGLGNPGEKYKNNRHNVGFMILDKFISSKGEEFVAEKKFNSQLAKTKDCIYVKPLSYMNRSGEVLSKIVGFYKIRIENILIVHDDVDLELGKVKMNIGSGSAGHNGVNNILEKLGSKDMWRIRVGVGKPDILAYSTEDWVLSDLSTEEIDIIMKNPDIYDGIQKFLNL